ncbi:chloride channel protein [Corynebacterium epidermidicanis]|uniref:chloride channel protein n=1 Tax=Corynebacterium epidermidicanis TaxID=1050174 RepID=UPI00064176CD
MPSPIERTPIDATPLNRLAGLAVLTGAVTGLLVAGLNWTVIGVERLVYDVDHLHNPDPTSQVSRLRVSLTLVCLGVVLSWAWYGLRRLGRKQVGVPNAMNGRPMPVLETLLSAFLQVASVAAGAPVGRENAPRLAGGLAGSWISTKLGLDIHARRLLVAAAAGAGLGATFHLPLAGALFALELLLVEMSTRSVVVTMLASATAVAVTGVFVKPHPVYSSVPASEDWPTLGVAILVGLVAGVIGHWFGVLARKAVAASPQDGRILWQLPAAFVVIGAVAYFVPGTSSNARSMADTMLTNGMPAAALLAVALLRFGATLLCLRVGVVGGTLTPAFGLGAIVGALLGVALAPLFPGVPVGVFALLGAAAFLSTAMAAPLFGLIAAVEFTDLAAEGYLPVFVAVASAAIGVRLWSVAVHRDQPMVPFTSALWTRD